MPGPDERAPLVAKRGSSFARMPSRAASDNCFIPTVASLEIMTTITALLFYGSDLQCVTESYAKSLAWTFDAFLALHIIDVLRKVFAFGDASDAQAAGGGRSSKPNVKNCLATIFCVALALNVNICMFSTTGLVDDRHPALTAGFTMFHLAAVMSIIMALREDGAAAAEPELSAGALVAKTEEFLSQPEVQPEVPAPATLTT